MNQLPDDILSTLKDHERRLNDMERAPRATSIIFSNTAYVSFSLPPGDFAICTFVLSEGDWEFPVNTAGWPRWTTIRDFTDPNPLSYNNVYPFGINWTLQNIEDLEIIPYMARDAETVPANRMVFYLIYKNRGASALNNIGVYLEWKLPQLAGATT